MSIFNEKVKKELNRIRPDASISDIAKHRPRGLSFNDIVLFLVDYYKKNKRTIKDG